MATRTDDNAPRPPRRTGDTVQIAGDYQHRALTQGSPIQRFWHRSKLDLVEWCFGLEAGQTVLDVGMGSGVLCDHMAKLGATVVGVDANREAVDYAKATFERDGVTFMHGLLDALDLEAETFDRAVSMEVIEHIYPHQVRKLLADMRRMLKPGGKLLITTPNYRGTWPVVEWAMDRFTSAPNMDHDQHVTHFHRAMLRGYLVDAGFEVERLRTFCTFAPFIAGVSPQAAEAMANFERRVDLPFGNLLAAVATKVQERIPDSPRRGQGP